jgi:TctA family transporter
VNIPLIGIWVHQVKTLYPLLFTGVVLFTCISVYRTQNNVSDMWTLLTFGLLSYFRARARSAEAAVQP